MSTRLSSVFPRPAANDPDDVVWTLQTAAVQWQRGLRADAVVWVRKAADTATQLGHVERAEELRNHAARLAEFLWRDPEEPLEGAPEARSGSGRRVLDRDDEGDEVIEVEEIEAFDDFSDEDDFSESDLPTPDDAAADLSEEDFAPYRGGVSADAGPVLPDDLDLGSDSDRPPVGEERDSFVSVNPEPDDDELRASRDSFMSVNPEPEQESDEYLDVSPESQSPRPASSSKISERPTQPRIPKPGLLGELPRAAEALQRHVPGTRAPAIIVNGGASSSAPAFERAASPPGGSGGTSVSSGLFDPKTLLDPSLPPGAASAVSPRHEPDDEEAAPAVIDGLALESVETLGDLPEEAQAELASRMELTELDAGQELVIADGVALITCGSVHVALPHSDVSAGKMGPGAVIAAHGSIESGPLRLIGGGAQTHVVTWSEAQITSATRDCPWVVDDLRLLADRYQAHASAGLGPLGARLDDALRAAVYERLQVRLLTPGEVVAERGKPLKGLYIAAVGELAVASGVPGHRIGPGDFVFPSCVIGAQPAPHDVKAGPAGSIVLFATRPVAHELMMSVPPLLEILAT